MFEEEFSLDIDIDKENVFSNKESTSKEEKEENVDSFTIFCDEILKRIEKQEIVETNYNDLFKKLEIKASKSEILSSETRVKYLLLRNFFLTWEKNKELDYKSEKIDKKTISIKSEILTMMGLFFAIFTFVQVNFTFTQQFLEKYNGYRLLLYIVIINAILLVVLGFILEAIGAIVYGENKVREAIISESSTKNWFGNIGTEKYKKSKKYLLFFPESKLKIKRALLYSLMGLFVIGIFSFYKEKKNYARSYEEIERIMMEEIDKKISTINKTLTTEEKEQIKLEIENKIYRDLYNKKEINQK